MNNKHIVIFILGIVLIPQLTFASWWNPWSWNENKETSEQNSQAVTNLTTEQINEIRQRHGITPAVATSSINVSSAPGRFDNAWEKATCVKAEPEIVTKDRIIEKQIKYDNPDLLNKITSLEAEINTYKIQISNLETEKSKWLDQQKIFAQKLGDYAKQKIAEVSKDCQNTIDKIYDGLSSSYSAPIYYPQTTTTDYTQALQNACTASGGYILDGNCRIQR